MPLSKYNIAIDGPSSAGKSSISDLLAVKLNLTHLDTGAMYRLVAYHVLCNDIALNDEERISELLANTDITYKGNCFYLNGNKLNDEIRQNNISLAASDVSKLKTVRDWLVFKQQAISKNGGFILDGRDIGTVVLKDAKYKFYLTADAKERAKRRVLQYQEKAIDADYDEIYNDILKRDYQDSHRENSPLKKADDAIEIDSSNLTIDEVVEYILSYIKE